MKIDRLVCLTLAALLPAAAPAAPNEGVMTYSGYLRTSSGAPETSAQSVTFRLYDAATGGNQLWSQTVAGVQPDGTGWFSVVLGASPSAFPPDGFSGQTWLGIQLAGEAEMVPRQKVGAAPAALSVEYAGISGCTAANQILQWSGTAWQCIATPAGGTGGGVASVGGATGGFITASTASGAVSLSLTGCGATAGQILQWNGTGWSCVPTPSGGGAGGVASVSPDLSSGLTISPTTGAVVASLRRDCTTGQILKWTAAGGWGCAADDDSGGTLTNVTVSGGGLSATGTTVRDISLGAATGTSSGYLTAADFAAFAAKAPPPGAACNAGQVLTWNGSAFQCVADLDTTYTGTAPVSVSGTGISLAPCAAGQVLKTNAGGTGWACGADLDSGGTVTSVTAAAAPIVVGGTASAPTIGITQAGASSNGFVTSADYAGWNAKVGTVTAGPGLSGGGSGASVSVAANFTTAGGTNGATATVARGDHSHRFVVNVPLSDLVLDTGASLASVTVGTGAWVKPKAVVVAANAAIWTTLAGAVPAPVSANPSLRVVVHNPGTSSQTYVFSFSSSGIVAGAALPDSRWNMSGNTTVTIPAGQTAIMERTLVATAVHASCNSATCPLVAPGDPVWFAFGPYAAGAPPFNVLGVQLLF